MTPGSAQRLAPLIEAIRLQGSRMMGLPLTDAIRVSWLSAPTALKATDGAEMRPRDMAKILKSTLHGKYTRVLILLRISARTSLPVSLRLGACITMLSRYCSLPTMGGGGKGVWRRAVGFFLRLMIKGEANHFLKLCHKPEVLNLRPEALVCVCVCVCACACVRA